MAFVTGFAEAEDADVSVLSGHYLPVHREVKEPWSAGVLCEDVKDYLSQGRSRRHSTRAIQLLRSDVGHKGRT